MPHDGCSGSVSGLEIDYVRGLIDHAEARGKIPVLTATRSLGRAVGLKRAFSGLHVLVYRNVFQQWCSVTDQALHGNGYFLEKIIEIIERQTNDPILKTIKQLFDTSSFSPENPDTFYVFVFLHLYLYTQAVGSIDMIIDVNLLEADISYRMQVEARIATQNITLDLSGVKNSIAYSICDFGSAAEFSEKIKVIGDTIIDYAPDYAGRDFGRKIISDLIEEHARHEFHVKSLRSVLLGPEGLRTERDAVRLERNLAVTRQSELSAERDAALALLGAAMAERDALASQCHNLHAGREAALAVVQATSIEHDALARERDTIASERDGLRADRETLSASAEALGIQRTALISERDAWHIKHDDACTKVVSIIAERDALISERDALSAERHRAVAAVTTATAERDNLLFKLDEIQREQTEVLAEAEVVRDKCDKLSLKSQALASDRDELRVDRDAMSIQAASMKAERDRLSAKCVALAEWAQADRDAVLASLSWRLTRPLRRLGIGRADRLPPPV